MSSSVSCSPPSQALRKHRRKLSEMHSSSIPQLNTWYTSALEQLQRALWVQAQKLRMTYPRETWERRFGTELKRLFLVASPDVESPEPPVSATTVSATPCSSPAPPPSCPDWALAYRV